MEREPRDSKVGWRRSDQQVGGDERISKKIQEYDIVRQKGRANRRARLVVGGTAGWRDEACLFGVAPPSRSLVCSVGLA